MLNPFFQQGAPSEQNLVQDLINEQLKMYGVEVHYLPRKYMDEKTVIREVVRSKFDDAYPLEAYVDTYDGYGENPVILSKFGIEQKNEVTLTISKDRWETYIQPLMKNEENVKLITRPKEGDLIYFPLGDRLFEIKYVEHEKPFYQLQKTYIYTLRCELFRYEDEVIDTGVEEIDDVLIGDESDGMTEDGLLTMLGPTQTLTMVGVGVTVEAVTGIRDGVIQYIEIGDRGGGYTEVPRVAISSAPSGGITGIASVRMIGGIVACNDNVNPGAKSVQNADLNNAGAGYTVAPIIRFVSNTNDLGAGATGISSISDGGIGIITMTTYGGLIGGGGFTTSPQITFGNEIFLSGVTTAGAAATAVVSTAGTITAIRITNAGAGYSTAPTITVANPSLTSSGNFIFNEVVTGSATTTTARVRTWDSDTNVLEVASIAGSGFQIGETLTGAKSGATQVVRVIDKDPLEGGYADNTNIETAADEILDFTEQNPFGVP